MAPRGLPLALVAALLSAAPAGAHHSFAVHFVADRLITVRGTVDEFTFRNPHGVLMVTAKGDDEIYEDSAVFDGVAARYMAFTPARRVHEPV